MIYIEMSKEKSDDESYSYNQLIEEGKELVDTGEMEYIDAKLIEKHLVYCCLLQELLLHQKV